MAEVAIRSLVAGFKKLAKDYASAGEDKIAALLRDEELQEICHED